MKKSHRKRYAVGVLCLTSFYLAVTMMFSLEDNQESFCVMEELTDVLPSEDTYIDRVVDLEGAVDGVKNTLEQRSGLVYEHTISSIERLTREIAVLKEELKVEMGKLHNVCNNTCNQTVQTSITVLFNLVREDPEVTGELPNAIRGLEEIHPWTKVLVALTDAPAYKEFLSLNPNLHLRWITIAPNTSRTSAWNTLLEAANTPYVYFVRNLLDFNKNSNLQTQILLISSTGALAVGGATRNINGSWNQRCFQFEIGPYTLSLQKQHLLSLNSCFRCDFIEGSVVVQRQGFYLDGSLSEEEAFLDRFLSFYTNKIGMSLFCPHMLSFGHFRSILLSSKSQLVNLAKKWTFDTLIFPNRQIHLSCSEANASCDFRVIMIQGYSMPRCCLREHMYGLKTTAQFLDLNSIPHHLSDGSLLAAVKLGHMSPWDVDSDIEVDDRDAYKILEEKKQWFYDRNIDMQTMVMLDSAFGRSGGMTIELYSDDKKPSTLYLAEGFHKNLTRVCFSGVWFYSIGNPGLYVRLQFGPHQLKHANSFWVPGAVINKTYQAGHFHSCRVPHHSCFSGFPVDGNLDVWPNAQPERQLNLTDHIQDYSK